MKTPFSFILMGLLAASCSPTLPTDTMSVEIPGDWKEPPPQAVSPLASADWWELFEDPLLSEFESQALSENKDLFVALERIFEARGIAQATTGKRYPQLELSPYWQKQGSLFQLSGFDTPAGGGQRFRVIQETYSLPIDASYEVDLWKKLSNQDAAAWSRYLSQQWNWQNVYQTVTADVANYYFAIRGNDEEIRIIRGAIKARQDSVDIHKTRVDAGLEPELGLSRSRLELAIAQSDLEGVLRQRRLNENALAVLLGMPASSFTVPEGYFPQDIQVPDVGLPSDLICRRPDIQEKQALVTATAHEVGVAKANFLPSFNMAGTLGLSSPDLAQWFDWQGRLWAFALSAAQTVFDGGILSGQKEAAMARYKQAVGSYEQQATVAFKEVEDALANLHFFRTQFDREGEAVEAAKTTFSLAGSQFKAGAITYLAVADAEDTLLDRERRQALIKSAIFRSNIQLIKAIGGNW